MWTRRKPSLRYGVRALISRVCGGMLVPAGAVSYTCVCMHLPPGADTPSGLCTGSLPALRKSRLRCVHSEPPPSSSRLYPTCMHASPSSSLFVTPGCAGGGCAVFTGATGVCGATGPGGGVVWGPDPVRAPGGDLSALDGGGGRGQRCGTHRPPYVEAGAGLGGTGVCRRGGGEEGAVLGTGSWGLYFYPPPPSSPHLPPSPLLRPSDPPPTHTPLPVVVQVPGRRVCFVAGCSASALQVTSIVDCDNCT
jgi:hypothetical protein